jgi:hypothetical protein
VYQQLAVYHLQATYPQLPLKVIREALALSNQHYFPARESVRKMMFGSMLDDPSEVRRQPSRC